MAKFTALTPVKHDCKRYAAGASIELTKAEAEALPSGTVETPRAEESAAARKAAEKAEAERKAAEKAEAERKAAEESEAAQKAAAERHQAEMAEAERKAAEQNAAGGPGTGASQG